MAEVLGRKADGAPSVESCIAAALARLPFSPEEGVCGRLGEYHALLEEANRHMNLTGTTDPETAVDRLYTSSLAVLAYAELLPEGAEVVDVGTGAGIPGMILAIARRDLHFLLLDSLGKRVAFLRDTANQLGLSNVECLHIRAEDAGRDPHLRERFDVTMARAVAPLNVLCELLLPLTRVGGHMLAYKGPSAGEELPSAQRAAKLLGAGDIRLLPLTIPTQPEWGHVLAVAQKCKSTPKAYPRKAGTPQKQPLGEGERL